MKITESFVTRYEGTMQRAAVNPWVWVDPAAQEPSYAVMRWKAGPLYAGPTESAVAFPPSLLDGSSMIVLPRADALRMALSGKVETAV